MKKLYIFDFDGTLVNTFYDSVIAYNKALKEYGLPEYEYESLDQIDYEDFTNNMTDNMDVLVRYSEIYEISKKEHTVAYEGVMQVLEKLANEEKELAICSNRQQEQLNNYVKKIFPHIPFKQVIGYTSNGSFKPNPEQINKIIGNGNYSKEEIIYVGDKEEDIITAKNVDLDVIIVTWGQGNEKTYHDSYPIKFIDHMDELLE